MRGVWKASLTRMVCRDREFGWLCSDGRYSVRALAQINFARIQGPPNGGLAGRMGSLRMGRAEATDQLASL